MKKIKNICISTSFNVGQEDIFYENINEIKKAFPQMPSEFIDDAIEQLNYTPSVIGVVKHRKWSSSYPKMIRVTKDEECDFEVLGNASQRFVDKPIVKEKIIKSKW